MVAVVLLVFGFACLIWIPFRVAVFNPISTIKYGITDLYKEIKFKTSRELSTGQIFAYVGLFGKGKTLSAVHDVVSLYNKYNGLEVWDFKKGQWITQKVHIISNVELMTVPYEKFESLSQVVQIATTNSALDKQNNTRTCTLVLGDEFSVQLNSRSFKDNINPLFLNTILTCRHHHISLFYTSQRFGHVDALLRQVTSYVIDCNKVWRFMCQGFYDAWEYENAQNSTLMRPMRRRGWFIKDSDFNAYDTLRTVGNLKKKFDEGDILTEEEILTLQSGTPVNTDSIIHPSRALKKTRK